MGEREVAQSGHKQHRPGRGVVERAPDDSGTISTTPIFSRMREDLSGACSFSAARTTLPPIDSSHIVLQIGDLAGVVTPRYKSSLESGRQKHEDEADISDCVWIGYGAFIACCTCRR